MTIDIEYLKTWIGKSETSKDRLHSDKLAGLAATLDQDELDLLAGDLVPPAWHWIFFNPIVRASGIGSDGHPSRGEFLPPVDLPRRMWAGGRIFWKENLLVDDPVTRNSVVADVRHKSGKSGDLVFVMVRHQITGKRGGFVEEEQDIVYRSAPNKHDPQPPAKEAPSDALWSRTINPDPLLLFRYSALTFNGHRIHYDYPYVTKEEGYPGLIVHGPLIATLLLDLCRRECRDQEIKRFEYRAMSPLFAPLPFTVNGRFGESGRTANLWASNANDRLAMKAEVEFAN
jgi:3-methylfumaryl-CoA hydratase